MTTTYYKMGHDLDEAESIIEAHGLDAIAKLDGVGMAVYDTAGKITYSSGGYVKVDVFNDHDAVIFRLFADDSFVEGPLPIKLRNRV